MFLGHREIYDAVLFWVVWPSDSVQFSHTIKVSLHRKSKQRVLYLVIM